MIVATQILNPASAALINTLLQQGANSEFAPSNRFNGFQFFHSTLDT
jgi:hypothetical protein